MHQPDDYCGPERRREERRFCPMDERITSAERDLKRLSHQVKHITDCLDGYRPFVTTLQKREELKNRLREKLLEQGVIWVMISLAGGVIAMVWYAATHWVKDVR